MVKQAYKIESEKITRLIHTRNFINTYPNPPKYTEKQDGEFQIFELHFNDNDERIKFLNDLRLSADLSI